MIILLPSVSPLRLLRSCLCNLIINKSKTNDTFVRIQKLKYTYLKRGEGSGIDGRKHVWLLHSRLLVLTQPLIYESISTRPGYGGWVNKYQFSASKKKMSKHLPLQKPCFYTNNAKCFFSIFVELKITFIKNITDNISLH